MEKFEKMIKEEDLWTENIKKNKIGALIESEHSVFWDGMKRQYHASTRDMITNEIFRRLDPKQRTMGEYLRDVVCPQIGTRNIISGAKSNEMSNLNYFKSQSMWSMMKALWNGPKSGKYYLQGNYKEMGASQDKAHIKMVEKAKLDAGYPGKVCPVELEGYGKKDLMKTASEYWQKPAGAKGEMGSVTMYGSARALAKLGAFMANGGSH